MTQEEHDESPKPEQPAGWTKERLWEDFALRTGWLGVALFIVGLVAAVDALDESRDRQNVAGALCALLVIVILFADYFFLPKPGDVIRAPNPWLRVTAGILAALSAILWMLASWPQT